MRRLDWFEPGEGATIASLRELQSKLGCVFPADFSGFALEHSGGSNPSECSFWIQDEGGRAWGSNFGAVLRIAGEGSETILGVMRDLGARLPPGVVPVVDTGFGDYVCLRFRGDGDPVVVYFMHDRPGEKALMALATTFSEFLETLEVLVDE